MQDLYTPDNTRFGIDLETLAASIKPDAEFTRQLETNLLSAIPLKSAGHARLRIAAAIVLILCGATLATLTIQPFRAIAQGIIDNLFQRADSDKMNISMAEPTSLIENPLTLFKSYDEASQITSFADRKALFIPSSFTVGEIYANQNALIQVYYRPGRSLVIDQQIIGQQVYDSPIGASATIDDVNIKTNHGILTGQHVKGTWIMSGPKTRDAQGSVRPVPFKWQGDMALHRLRWQDEGIVYDIVAGGGSADEMIDYVSLEDMVRIAESMYAEPTRP